jgi:signal transduction histidine kinase
VRNLNLKKFFLYLLIGSVAISALLGIGVILLGDFGEIETKILLTTLTITCTSILGLACGAFLETGRGKFVPVGGIIFAVLSAVLWIYLIWHNIVREEFFVRTLFSVTILATSCSLISLVSLAKLDRRFLWSRYALHVSVWSLTAILLYFSWTQFDAISDFISRTMGVLSIIVAALTVVTPVFHRLSSQKSEEEIDAEIARLRAQIEELEKQKSVAGEKEIFSNAD